MKKILLALWILTVTSVTFSEKLTISDFSPGLNTKSAKTQLLPGQCYDVQNLLFDEKPRSAVTRSGTVEISSFPEGGEICDKLWELNKPNGERYLIAQVGDTLYFTVNETEWTVLRTGLSHLIFPLQMAIWEGKAFFTNGINYPFYFTGNLFDDVYYKELELGFLKGRYILADKNKLLIGGTLSQPNGIFYTETGLEDPADVDSWAADNYEVVGNDEGDYLTGMVACENDVTLALKRYSTWGLFGYGNPINIGGLSIMDWSIIRIDPNKGCLFQESVASYRGSKIWLSHLGLVSYNGVKVEDQIDYFVEPDFKDCTNLDGEYYYLQLNDSTDFGAGAYVNMPEDINELKLKEYKFTWEEDYLAEGTNSNTLVTSNYVKLATSTVADTGRVDYADYTLTHTVQTILNKRRAHAYIAEESRWYFKENVYPMNEELEGYTTSDYYRQWYNVTESTFSIQMATKKEAEYDRYGVLTLYDDKEDLFTSDPQFIYKFSAVSGDGIDVQGITMTADFILEDLVFYYNNNTHNEIFVQNLTLNQKMTITCTDVNGKEHITIADLNTATISSMRLKEHYSDEISISPIIDFGGTGRTMTIDIDTPENIKEIEVKIHHTFEDSSVSKWSDIAGLMYFWLKYKADITPIYDLYLTENTSEPVYESSGYYQSVSTNISGVTNNVEYGYLDYDIDNDYELYQTTVALQIRTSTDNNTFTAWLPIDSTSTLITCAPGTYVQWGATLTAGLTNSTFTPKINWVKVKAIEPAGYWTSKKYNVGKVDGGWYYLVTDDDADSQTLIYYIKLGTSTTDLDYTAWSTIETGDLITGTTNETWAQFKSSHTTDNGSQNPTCNAINAIYAPVSAPVFPSAINIDGRYLIAISSSGTENTKVMVLDKQGNWTKFTGWQVNDFTKFGNSYYYADNAQSKIYKLDPDATDDDGTPITSEWKGVYNFFDFTYDKSLNFISIVGPHQDSGYLYTKYKVAVSSIEYSSGINIEGDYRFRHIISVEKSKVQYFEIIHKSTAPVVEINGMDLHFTTDTEIRQ